MICYWSVHCMLRSTLWFVTGQNTVRYDQVYDLLLVSTLYVTTILVYDLLLVRTLYVMTKFMICYWSECCMLRPSLWFVTGQNTVCYDQVYDMLLFRTPYVTISNSYILIDCCVHIVFDQVYDLLLFRTPYATIDGTNLIFGHKLHIVTPYRGKHFWTHQIPTSCLPTLLIFIHIEHICSFFVAFFSATIDGRNLIFGHKLHIGTPYRGKRFWPIRFLHPVCRRAGVS